VVSTNTLSFQNRATLQKQGVKCRFVHRGVPKLQEVKEMITRAKDIAQVGIVQLLEAQQQIINKDYALAFTKNIEALPKRIYDILEEEWEEVAELNRLQVASRILVLAQELPLFQRITVEQAACGITKVFDNFQSRMMEIAQAMANQEE
jgi:1-aminocyclopropane-1-carboxylate deaminase/D-cysteine desulfhydrase-like pyridoxal-dependent ACC family enzyme